MVLIVEDEIIIALDLEDMVVACGLTSTGPFARVSDALAAMDEQLPNCAILDVHLSDGDVFPLADRLRQANVPIIFHSGKASRAELLQHYPLAQICPKPASHEELRHAIQVALTHH